MPISKHIQLLPDHVINKIAAGEVVDRPAAVVKELLENALDAGATELDIQIISGGRKLIRIADNGRGMGRDDALLAIERHATSKICDVEDIENISTMGFRGEALAAIASVSRFTLLTRLQEEMAGTEISISGGRLSDVRDAGCPTGTTITIRNLFFNIPARRKFMRSEQTESAHIRQVFLTYAFARPDVSLRLVVDDREMYRLPGDMTLKERLRCMFDTSIIEALKPVDYTAGPITVSGFVADSRVHRNDRTAQYFFINQRPASAPILGFALRQAYENVLPKGRSPVVFIFIEIEPSLVDVNVHPAKREVRFRQPSLVRDACMAAIRSALGRQQVVTGDNPLVQEQVRDLNQTGMKPNVSLPVIDVPPTRPFDYPSLPLEDTGGADLSGKGVVSMEKMSSDSPWGSCRILGRIGGLYIILEVDDGMILMDPQAAHERVLYERMLSRTEGQQAASQGLLAPETVELPPRDALRVSKNLQVLQEMGFGISEFGGDSFLIDAVPVCMNNTSPSRILLEVATGIDQGGAGSGKGKWTRERVAQTACRSAVNQQDALTMPEISRLISDLATCEMPYTCPHGRPTVIFTSLQELARKFGRG